MLTQGTQDNCPHCGMPGHVRANCEWAKRSDRELAQEAARRKIEVEPPAEPDIDVGGF